MNIKMCVSVFVFFITDCGTCKCFGQCLLLPESKLKEKSETNEKGDYFTQLEDLW